MSTSPPSSSRWSRPVRPASPHSRTSSSSTGEDSSGRFGKPASVRSSCSSTSARSACSAFAREETSFMAAIASEASPPPCFAWPIALLAWFCSARSASSAGSSSRRRASSRSTSSSRSAARRRSKAARAASGSRRSSFRSSTGRRPPEWLLRRGLRARVALEEDRHVAGVLAGHDVRGHDRAGEAAVADRVQNILARFLADVEVRAVGALAALDLAGRFRAVGIGRLERVASGAAIAEQHGPAVNLIVVLAGHLDVAAAAGRERGAGHEAAGDEAAWPLHGRAYYPPPCRSPSQVRWLPRRSPSRAAAGGDKKGGGGGK